MIELALSLTDYLLKLLQKREDNIDEYFEQYIMPAFAAAEDVYKNYLGLLTKIRRKIEQNEHPLEIIEFLEEGRLEYLPVRMRLRAEILSRFDYVYESDGSQYTNFDKLPRFERGILGILMGGLAPFEDKSFNNTPYYQNHTLLDVLYRFSSYVSGQTDERNFLYAINEQIQALNNAWQDVVTGYSEYKLKVVPTPKSRKFTKPVQPKSNSKDG
jgi:hypothetical protein